MQIPDLICALPRGLLTVCVCRGVFTATLEDEEVSRDQPDLASNDSSPTDSKHRGFASVVQILVDDVIKPCNQLEE